MLSNFCSVGIGHRQLDISNRSRYAFPENKQLAILDAAREQGIEGLMILSTCNRSEFYAFGCPLPQLYQFFIQQLGETTETDVLIWQKQGLSAIEHLLFVASSLDSQILGDLQIINQIKRSWQKSQEKGLDHPKMNRWVDHALCLNKQIKSQTKLSHGAASAAYACLQSSKQWLKHRSLEKSQILLLGMGEIGRSSCLNIAKHLPQAKITISNRTYETAATFGERYQLPVIKWEERLDAMQEADIIVVGTAAKEPILLLDMLPVEKEQLLLDLSVPLNIDPAIGEYSQKSLRNLDHLGQIKDQTLQIRKQAIPHAKELLKEEVASFCQWLDKQRFNPLIAHLKAEMEQQQQAEMQRYAKRNPQADLDAAEAVGQHLIHSLTAKLARFINQHNGALSSEFSELQNQLLDHA